MGDVGRRGADRARARPRIGDRCYIGPNTVVAKGVTIGDGCVVGAGSVVLADLPPGSRAAGAPCRMHRRRRRDEQGRAGAISCDQALRQSVAYGTATILSRATMVVALLVLPFLLTPRDYGALSMIVTVAALVAIVGAARSVAGSGPLLCPRPAGGEEGLCQHGAGPSLFMTLLGFLVLGQALAEPLCVLVLGDPSILPAFRVALLLMALNCLFYFLQNQCRWEFRTAEFVLISLVFAFFTLALSLGLGMVIDPPLFGVVLGQVVGAAIAVGLGAFGLRRSFALRMDAPKLRQMLSYSLPLVPASIALFLNVYASRIILNALVLARRRRSLHACRPDRRHRHVGHSRNPGRAHAALSWRIITSRRRRDSLRACSR